MLYRGVDWQESVDTIHIKIQGQRYDILQYFIHNNNVLMWDVATQICHNVLMRQVSSQSLVSCCWIGYLLHFCCLQPIVELQVSSTRPTNVVSLVWFSIASSRLLVTWKSCCNERVNDPQPCASVHYDPCLRSSSSGEPTCLIAPWHPKPVHTSGNDQLEKKNSFPKWI